MASVVKNIFNFKCPACHEGDLFLSGPYDLGKIGKMPPRCPVCGQDFKIEIGFYWGAMYVAYGLGVATSLLQFLIYFLLFNMGFTSSLVVMILVQIVISPWLYHLSRSIWIHMFVRFGKKAGQ